MPILTKSKQTDATPSDKAARSGTAKRAAAARGRTPTKTSINLATVGVKRTRWWLVILVLALIVVAAAAIGKFLVYDRLQAVDKAQNEAAAVRSEVDSYTAKIESYGELNDLFAHYTYSGMTAEEQSRVDRVAVMDLIQTVIMPQLDVSTWSITGNKLRLTVQGNSLQTINLIAQKLMEDEMVSYCEVNTAATGANKRSSSEKVAANMVVYLVKPEEVAGK